MSLSMKLFAASDEVRRAIGLIKYGLASLQSIDMTTDFYDLPLILLASGLERLCKTALAFWKLEKEHVFPSRREMMDYGHDVKELANEVLNTCFDASYLDRQATKEDKKFLES